MKKARKIEPIKTICHVVKTGILLQAMCIGTAVNAGSLQNSQLVKGTLKLIDDATAVLLVVEAGLVGVLILWQLMQYKAAGEVQDKVAHKKSALGILAAGIIGICVTAGVKIIFSYYQ